MKLFRFIPPIVAGVLIAGSSAHATPYAAGVSVSGTTVSWHLNESVTNGVVAYLFNVSGGAYAASNYVGGAQATPVTAGPQSFSISGYTNFQIFIFNIGTGVPHQISPNPGTASPASPLVDFYGPRGVGVNRNPNSTNFGRIYVVNASAAADSVRATGRGAYAVNSDFTDAFGYGATAMPAGIPWAGSTTYGLWRVFVGPDDMVYVSGCSASTGTSVGPGVVMCPPNLSSGIGMFPNNASGYALGQYTDPVAAVVTGSYAAGNLTLYTCEFDRSGPGGYQTVWQYPFYTVGGSIPNPAPLTYTGNGTPLPLPWNVASVTPNLLPTSGGCGSIYGYGGNGNPNIDVGAGIGSFNGVLADMYIAPDGKFFCSEERSANTGSQGLWVYDSITNGNCLLWDDLDVNGGVSPFATAYSVSVSPDGSYMAMGCSSASGNTVNNGKILVCSLDSQPAATGVNVSGLPDLSRISRITYDGNSSLRGTAWDMADNIYCVSGSDDSMRAFTLGLTTTAITGNDTTGANGTFLIGFASTSVSVSADEALVSQANSYGTPTSGTFTLTRTGSTDSPLTASFTLTGTATNGVTYTASPSNSVTFPIGASTVQVTITPNANIASATTLGVTLSVLGNANYSAAPPTSATMAIANTGPQEIGITAVLAPSLYRGVTNDFASFLITRFGDTNAASYSIPASSFTYGGTATVGADYTAIGAVTFNPGDQAETVQVSGPITTGVYHGNETILVSLNGSAGVPLTSSLTATMTLVDNADPPSPLLWSDALTNATDSTNWNLTFANSNTLPVLITNYPNYTAANPDPNIGPPNGTGVDDFDVQFGYDVTNDNVGYSPTMILNGWTNALKMTVNKLAGYDGYASGGASAGVNVYPNVPRFTGNYALRFGMNLVNATVYTTEACSYGINCYGTNCNWFAEDFVTAPTPVGYTSYTNQDGLWYDIDADADLGANLVYIAWLGAPIPNAGPTNNYGAGAGSLTNVFKYPVPYSAYPGGAPADGDGPTANNTWSDVEVKQVNGIVTMSVNKAAILRYTNSTIYTSGAVMLGYDDPYGSVSTSPSPTEAAVYYSNVRVVRLTPPAVSGTTLSGSTLTIKFTDSDTDDTAASFQLLGSTTLNGTFTKATATFTQIPATGGWQAVVTVPNGTVAEFYKVVRTE